MTTAYSYIRFSTANQSAGDSLRRQTDLAKAYAAKQGLTLDDRSFLDLGISGFDRSNLEKGALAAFLAAVKSGTIRAGSYLLIENFDRLSRAAISVAVRLLLDLTAAGVVVVTLMDERIWDTETVNDLPNLMYSLLLMSRANEESATKSKRLRQAWGNKKAKASTEILTAVCPQWLKLRADRSGFDVLADRVESIKKVFKLRAEGHGSIAISRRANAEKWPAPGFSGTWHTSLITRLLKNRALLGEYQPHENREGQRRPAGEVVPGYFPVIVSAELWAQAQAVGIRHAALPRRRSYRNVFQGLLKCECGASFVRKNKSSRKQLKYAMYYCVDRLRGVTKCASVPALDFEIALLDAVCSLSPASVADSQSREVDNQIDSLESVKAAVELRRQRLIAAIEGSDQPILPLIQQLTKVQAELDAVDGRLNEARNSLIDLLNIEPDEAFDSMAKLMYEGTDDERSALRERLLRVISHVDVHSGARYIRVHTRIAGLAPIIHPLAPGVQLPGITPLTLEEYNKKLMQAD
jgi:DNA invertase Pin-like site-specific DNA recombinase